MRKYWAFFRVSVQDTLTYRGPMVIWIINDLITILCLIAVWFSVTAGQTIAGFSRNELISYYIISLFLQWFNGWFPFFSVIDEIRKGDIVGSLIKPYSYYIQKLFSDLGWHTISVWVGLISAMVVWVFFRQYFIFNIATGQFFLVLLAALLSILVTFGISICMGLVAFWFSSVWALNSVFWWGRNLLGGQAIPTSFIPGFYQQVIRFLPFRYTFSFPLEIYFNKINQGEIIFGFIMQIIWVVFFYYLYHLMWEKGRKVYNSFGQ